MASAEELLEELLEKQLELVRARKGSEREEALEARIAELETRFAEKPKDDRDEAIEELDDDEWELVRAHRRAKETPEPEPEDEPEDEPEEGPKARMRRGRKRGQVYQDGKGEPGYVWQSDDEPELVPVEKQDEAA